MRGPLRRLGDAVWRSPPRRYRLSDYKRWFGRTATVFLRYLKRHDALGALPGETSGGAVGVVVLPWTSTPVPWYSVMLAIGLARRGRPVVVLWDDTGFVEVDVDAQNRQIARVLSYVGRRLPVVRLRDESPASGAPSDAALVDRLTEQNLTWRLRGGPPTAEDRRAADDIRSSLAASLPLIRAALAGQDLDCLVVPNGVYGTAGLFLHEAKARGRRVATFDTDRAIAQICVDEVAAQNGDIPRAFHEVWDADGEIRSQAVDVARAELERRMASSDEYGFQTLPARGASVDATGAILMPLNVEWDTAALGKHVHFESTADWVTSTITAILERDAGPVIVRQHPSERRTLQRSRLDVGSILREHFGDDRRCRFVAADDPVNTYDLLRSARLVLPFVSTIAIEGAAIGKPVLVAAPSYYSDLGFVWSAGSREEYFALLERGLRGDLAPLPDQSDRAWVCYYLTAVRNRVSTDFTPHPDLFWEWARRPPDSLFADAEVCDILEAIDRDVPISLLRHRRALRSSVA